MKRLLIHLTCFAMMIGAIGHVWAMPKDPSGRAVVSASHTVPASQLTETASTQEPAEFGVSMDECLGHVHSASGVCAIDAVQSSMWFHAPDRIWSVNRWNEADSRLKAAALMPASPPPISMS